MSDSGLPVDTYISRFQEYIRKRLEEIRKVIKESAPDSVETMSYGIPTYRQGKNLVHFAGYKKHIGFYPTPSGIEAFREELSSFEISKGTVKFPHDKPVLYDLIRKIVEYRVNEVSSEK